MKTSIFQIVLLVILGLAFAVGVLIFAGVLPGFRAKKAGSEVYIVMWGQIKADNIANLIDEVNKKAGDSYKVTYIEKNPATINDDLLEALAAGTGPDLILLPHELIFQNRNKISPLPFESFTERQFQDYFVDAGQVFRTSKGWLALPVAVDPLVLYYNKDLYTNANIVNPPTNWEEFVANQPKLTVFDNLQSLSQSAVSLGTSNNVTNFKDILSLLLMQVGTAPLSLDTQDNYTVGFSSGEKNGPTNLGMSLDFYNQFSNPQRSTYTWNRSLAKDTEVFLSGKLANYFGLASELASLAERNPHLNFDVASVPRLTKGVGLTVGHLYGLAAIKNSAKNNLAFSAIAELALQNHSFAELSSNLGAAPVRRSLLIVPQANPSAQVFYREALVCRAWPDPEKSKTSLVFKNLIDDSSTGRMDMKTTIEKANKALQLIIDNSK
jgi:ABC-type glycerol-3-phosphate transport system substrate-binding protein